MEDMCNKCGLCCKLIPVDISTNSLLRDGIRPLDVDFSENLLPLNEKEARKIDENYVETVLNIFPNASFFRCKFLSPVNLCTKLQIPQECLSFPSHPLALIPDGCGFSGEIFLKSEEIKQRVRRYKEEITHYEALIVTNPKEEKCYQKIILSLQRFINKYQDYGSDDW